MPTYKNISAWPQGAVTTDGCLVTVAPGATIETYRLLGAGWEKASDEPLLPLTGLRKNVTAPGSVSGLQGFSLITLMAKADGIVVTPNATGNPNGYELSNGVVVEVDNRGEIESLYFTGTGAVLVQGLNDVSGGTCGMRLRRPVPVKAAPPVYPPVVYPENLSLLWRSSNHSKSLVGSDPQFSGTPVVDEGGVAPGHGPSFAAVSALDSMGTLAVRFTTTKAIAAISGEEHIFGPVYARPSGLVASDGTNKATFATTWNAGEVVTAIVQIQSGQMRIGRA